MLDTGQAVTRHQQNLSEHTPEFLIHAGQLAILVPQSALSIFEGEIASDWPTLVRTIPCTTILQDMAKAHLHVCNTCLSLFIELLKAKRVLVQCPVSTLLLRYAIGDKSMEDVIIKHFRRCPVCMQKITMLRDEMSFQTGAAFWRSKK